MNFGFRNCNAEIFQIFRGIRAASLSFTLCWLQEFPNLSSAIAHYTFTILVMSAFLWRGLTLKQMIFFFFFGVGVVIRENWLMSPPSSICEFILVFTWSCITGINPVLEGEVEWARLNCYFQNFEEVCFFELSSHFQCRLQKTYKMLK